MDEFPNVEWRHGMVPKNLWAVLDRHELMGNYGEFEAIHSESAQKSWLYMHPIYDDLGNVTN